MLGPFDNDDEDFCNPISGSNLAKVFNTKINSETDNESLIYIPPKEKAKPSEAVAQPGSAMSEESPKRPFSPKVPGRNPPATTCIIAKIVTIYQRSTNKTSPIGPVGLALLKLTAFPDVFKLVLYTGAKKTIATATTNNKNIRVTLQANKYFNIYDDTQQSWTILFLNQNDCTDFVAEMKKCNIKFVENASKLSKDSPDNEMLNNLKKITENMNLDKPEEATAESEEKSKAELLKRMAKMGQAIILPKHCSTSEIMSDSTDSNEDKGEPQIVHKKCTKPLPAAKKHVTIKMKDESVIAQSSIARPKTIATGLVPSSFSNGSLNANQNVVNVGGVNYLYLNGQLIPVPLPEQTFPTLSQQNLVNPYSGTDPLSLLFAEHRTHNSELRMNVNRMSDKVEKLYDRLEKLDMCFRISNADYETEADLMKMSALLPKLVDAVKFSKLLKVKNDEIVELQLENSGLKAELKAKENSLLREIDRPSEDAEIGKFESQIKQSAPKLAQLEDGCAKIGALKSENEELGRKIQLLQQQLADTEKANAYGCSLIDDKNKEIDKLKIEVDKLKEQASSFDAELEVSKAQSKEQTDIKVKNVMNALFRKLLGQFSGDSVYSGEEVANIIARSVKVTTIKKLEQN